MKTLVLVGLTVLGIMDKVSSTWICSLGSSGADSTATMALSDHKHEDRYDPIYLEKTDKTYDQLVDSGEYWPMEAFENVSEAVWWDHDALVPRTAVQEDRIEFLLYNKQK